jgi:DNA-binding transcriptional LysR family regulator
MAPELRHLRHFLVVAEELNFTRAAQRLFIAQQALSASIRQLENELGVKLFDRTTRRVALTTEGDALVDPARRLVAQAEELFETVRAGSARAELRVDLASSGFETSAAVLRELRATCPELIVHQRELGVPRGISALRSGQLDLLFGNAVNAPDDVAVRLVRLEPIQVMLAADHPSAGLPEVPVATLAEETWLLPSDEMAPEWVAQVVDLCQQAGFRPRRYGWVTHGNAAAAELAAEGACVVPTVAWTRVPPEVVLRPLSRPTTLFPWSMMWLAGHPGPGVLQILEAARVVALRNGWRPVPR